MERSGGGGLIRKPIPKSCDREKSGGGGLIWEPIPRSGGGGLISGGVITDVELGNKKKIHKLPSHLRSKEHSDVYDPKVVSIGPYHHGKPQLQLVQRIKRKVLDHFIQNSSSQRQDYEFYFKKMLEVVGRAQSCYIMPMVYTSTNEFDDPFLVEFPRVPPTSLQQSIWEFENPYFAEMMLLDGCFLLNYLLMTTNYGDDVATSKALEYYSPLDIKTLIDAAAGLVFTERDILLLDNQIPLWIIELLFNARYCNPPHTWKQLLSMRSQQVVWEEIVFENVDELEKHVMLQHDDDDDDELQHQDDDEELHHDDDDEELHDDDDDDDDDDELQHYHHHHYHHDDGLQHYHHHELQHHHHHYHHDDELQHDDDDDKEEEEEDDEAPLHLLEYCHMLMVSRPSSSAEGAGIVSTPRMSTKEFIDEYGYLFSSVMDLKSKGIHFSRNYSDYTLRGIKFDSDLLLAEVKLPVFDATTVARVFLQNMIAYELCNYTRTQFVVGSYINFMKSLIVSPGDVKELREKRIIRSAIGEDNDVVKLFHGLNTYGFDNPVIFRDVKHKILKHYNSKTKTWLAEFFHTYFRSPWTAIALFAATFLLVLTFLQTYFTINPRGN